MAKVSPIPPSIGVLWCGDGQVCMTWRLACLFFFRGDVIFIGKETMAIPNPSFYFSFFEQKFIQMVDFIMMLSHERIELVLKTKGQLSDNYSSYHHVHVKIRNATIHDNQLLLIDGHSFMVQNFLQHVFSKKTWNFMPFYLPSTTIRTAAIRTAVTTEPCQDW